MRVRKVILCVCLFAVMVASYLYTKERIEGKNMQPIQNYTIVSEVEENIDNSTIECVKDEDLAKVKDYIPDAVIDIRYATTNNFTGKVIYEDDEAYLRYGTLKKLKNVQDLLKKNGFKIVIWDAYRPVEAQYKLWEVCPDSRYVANPNNGYSKHSRGNTIDIAIVNLDGGNVILPSEYDDFTKKADRDYNDVSEEARANAEMIERIMEKCGFEGYKAEWWHYTDTTDYDIVKK